MASRIAGLMLALAVMVGCGSSKSPLASSEPGVDDQEAVAKLVVSANPVAGTCEKCAGLKLVRNPTMADATPTVPTGVEGATSVRLASATLITFGGSEGFRVATIAIQSDVVVKGIFGQYFRNLRLVDGSTGTQLGETIGFLTGDGPFEFHLSPALETISGQALSIEVYADIALAESLRPWLATATDPDGAVAFLPIQGTGVRTGRTVTSNALKGLQRVYIADHGSFTVALSARSPAEQFARAGDEVVAGIYTVRVSTAEGISLTEWRQTVILKYEDGRVSHLNSSVGEVTLYKDIMASANVLARSSVVAADDPAVSGRVPFVFQDNPLNVEPVSSRDVIVTFKIPPEAVPGIRVQFALYPKTNDGLPSVLARGTTSAWTLVDPIPEPILSSEVIIVE